MAGVKTIAKAWIQVLKGTTTAEHRRRSAICKACPMSEHRKFLNLVGDELIQTKGMICKMCVCPLSAKIRSDDGCPLGKWEE